MEKTALGPAEITDSLVQQIPVVYLSMYWALCWVMTKVGKLTTLHILVHILVEEILKHLAILPRPGYYNRDIHNVM